MFYLQSLNNVLRMEYIADKTAEEISHVRNWKYWIYLPSIIV